MSKNHLKVVKPNSLPQAGADFSRAKKSEKGRKKAKKSEKKRKFLRGVCGEYGGNPAPPPGGCVNRMGGDNPPKRAVRKDVREVVKKISKPHPGFKDIRGDKTV